MTSYETSENGWFVFRGLWPGYQYGPEVIAPGHRQPECHVVVGEAGVTHDVGKVIAPNAPRRSRRAGRGLDRRTTLAAVDRCELLPDPKIDFRVTSVTLPSSKSRLIPRGWPLEAPMNAVLPSAATHDGRAPGRGRDYKGYGGNRTRSRMSRRRRAMSRIVRRRAPAAGQAARERPDSWRARDGSLDCRRPAVPRMRP